MNVKLDSDVQAVLEFMQTNMAASKLVPVASAIGKLVDFNPKRCHGFNLKRGHPFVA